MRNPVVTLLTDLLDGLDGASEEDDVVAAVSRAIGASEWFTDVAVDTEAGGEMEAGLVRLRGDRATIALRNDGHDLPYVRATVVGDAAAAHGVLHLAAHFARTTVALLNEERLRSDQAIEVSALHQVMEGVAAATTIAQVAEVVLDVLMDAYGWDAGVVVAATPGGEGAEAPTVLAARHHERVSEECWATLLNGDGGLRGTAIDEVLPGAAVEALLWPLHKPSDTRLVLVSTTPIARGHRIGRVLASTAQVASIARVGLDRIEQVAAQQAALQAKRANQAKSEFLSRMSHELRTPLNAVLGFTQVLQQDELGADAMESLGEIRRAGAHLLDLVNEVLDIARIEAGRLALSLEPIELNEIVAECASLIGPAAVGRGIRVAAPGPDDPPAWARGDRQRVKQVVVNLLSNAVKYNLDGGAVEASVELGDEWATVRVRDTGAGIAPEKMDRLFTPFERLGAEEGTTEGTGLGLALSRRLAEAMQGTLTATSTLGEGTTFTLRMPGSDADSLSLRQGEAVDAVDLTEPGTAGRVLYVEDNRPNAKLVERVLRRRPGVEVRHAPDGAAGLEMARTDPPDLVLLDLDLPDVPGPDLLLRLRGVAALADVPVVIVSADATPQRVRGMLERGAVDYLTKPFDIGRLLQIVDDHLPVASTAASAESERG